MYKVKVVLLNGQVIEFEAENSFDSLNDGRVVCWYEVRLSPLGKRMTNYCIPIHQIIDIEESDMNP